MQQLIHLVGYMTADISLQDGMFHVVMNLLLSFHTVHVRLAVSHSNA